jgi:hypothetical protein
MHGAPHSVTSSDHLLADNGALHEQILALFGEIFGGRFPVQMPQIGG